MKNIMRNFGLPDRTYHSKTIANNLDFARKDNPDKRSNNEWVKLMRAKGFFKRIKQNNYQL